MLGKVIVLSAVAATAILVVLLLTTEPATIGPVGILGIFILMYVSVLGVLTFLLHTGSKLMKKMVSPFAFKRPFVTLSLRRAYYFSSVIALAPVMIIGMQSVGGVGVYELLLIGFFEIVACIYIAKRTN